MSNDGNNSKPNKRYLANIVNQQTQYGVLQKAMMNNLSPQNKDGSANTYYTGNLIWADAITNKKYLVKQLKLQQTQNGKAVMTIELDNEYEVQELG